MLSLGQAYHPFPHGTALYSFAQSSSTHTWLFAVAADSLTTSGQDSVFHLYRITRPLVDERLVNCYGDSIQYLAGSRLIGKDHYLGRQVRMEPNGDCHFELSNGQSHLLRCRAAVGTSWTWNGPVTATVDSLVLGTVLGQPDSLKYISLSSGQTVVISLAHGLVDFHNLYPFVGHDGALQDVTFSIWGIPALGLGGHLPGYGDIFQFHAGDRFQYQGRMQEPNGYSDRYKTLVVASQTQGSRFEYQDSLEMIQFIHPNSPPDDTIYSPMAAMVENYDSVGYLFLGLLPYQTSPDLALQIGMRIRAGSTRVEMDFANLSYFDTCSQAHILFESVGFRRFTEGLGLTHREYSDVGWYDWDTLICYQVQGDSWGNCLDLGSIVANEPLLAEQLKLYPNPATDKVRLALPAGIEAAGGKIEIYNAAGTLVRKLGLTSSAESLIDLDGLPEGLLLVRVMLPGHDPATLRLLALPGGGKR